MEWNKAMQGTRGVDESKDEQIWVSLGYYYIPEWISPCMLKLEESVWTMLVDNDKTLGKVARIIRDDYLREKKKSKPQCSAFQMIFRWLNFVRPQREDLIEIDISKRFDELKFPTKPPGKLYHDYHSWLLLEQNPLCTHSDDLMKQKLEDKIPTEKEVMDPKCDHPMRLRLCDYYQWKRDNAASGGAYGTPGYNKPKDLFEAHFA